MKYALGNMLNGAGGLNADQLALDMQFAADKTLTARKGPTPTFTRASNGTFVGSNGLVQTAGNNVARFDHDPVTLASRGLLIEESRTNLSLQSEDFSSASWNASSQRNLSVAANNIASPSGATDADKLTVGSTTTVYQVLQNTATLTSGTAYSISCFFKAGEITRVGIYTGNPVTLPINGIFELTGSGSIIGTPLGTASIQSFGNGWYRCIVTGTAGANSSTTLRISPISGTSGNYPGNGVDSFYAWGAQLEAGSFPTSYIPTTTTSVVRSADVCSISGAGFTGMWNATEGSLFTSAIFNAPVAYGSGQVLVDVNDPTSTNRLRYIRNLSTGTPTLANTSNSTLNVLISGSTALQPVVAQKYSAGFKLDDYVFYVNNSQIGTDNLGAMIVSPTTLTIGDASAGATRQYTNGTISTIRYYRKRLPNSKLQAITV